MALTLMALPDDLVLGRRYDVLGMEDIFLDFAGRKRKTDPVHEHLSGLRTGEFLFAKPKGEHIELHDEKGVSVAQLSQAALKKWHGRLECIEKITVLAMMHRLADDSREEFRAQCRCEQWEVPVAEVVYREVSLSS